MGLLKSVHSRNLLVLALLSAASHTVAQDIVDINVHVKHSVNGFFEFDRSRHIIFHEDISGNEWDSDQQKIDLFEGYDVYFGRNNGAIVWEYNNTREDPNKPGWPDLDYMQTRGTSFINSHKSDVGVHQLESRYGSMMIGGQERMYPNDEHVTSRGGLKYASHEALAEFYANYISKFFGSGGTTGRPQPTYLEVMNEPFVKANSLGTTRESIADLHKIVANRVRELNPDIKVGGYSAAHPQYEGGDFNHWRNNWKMFIDRAGADMDFFSFHLYDNAPDGTDMLENMTYRSGSNIQAIMDMLNHYSVIKLGETKPWSISEYGFLCSGCEDNSPYDPREDWYNLRSFNSMLLQFLERQDQIIHSIPFFLLKANWAKPADAEYNGYQARLMRELGELPGEPAHGGYIFTHLLKFFQFWAELDGTRVDTWTKDPDIQVDAYADENRLFVVINSLEFDDRELLLNLNGLEGKTLNKLTITRLYGDENDLPILDTLNHTTYQNSITIKKEATTILKYEFADNIEINEENSESTYFADTYFKPIKAGEVQNYAFKGLAVGEQGEAILRLGLGRDHGKSLKPSLKINGTSVEVPDDWRGFDQKTRDSFFGVIEVPVPHNILETDNTVEITFADTGGYVSSLGMQVFNFSTLIERSEGTESTLLSSETSATSLSVYPNPVEDLLYLDLTHQNSQGVYNILDLSGRSVLEGNIVEQINSINMSHLQAGIYTVMITIGDQNEIRKVIKK
ncbi:MAG: T9SS type A sorting domain-containing protein [Cyclobacteriaceae bacterium]